MESNGWDSSVVQRPIVIMSMNDTIGLPPSVDL